MRRLALSVLPLALLATACGEIPQPYRHEGPAAQLARPKMTRGVAVRPPEDGPRGEALAQALVDALGDQEIAALVQGAPAFGHQIEGRTEDLGPVVEVFWSLKAPDGTPVAGARQSVPKSLLAEGEAKRLKAMAQSSAALLALPLADPDALPAAAEKPAGAAADTRPVVRLAPLRGLPGDGDKALAEALRRALTRQGVVVRDDGAAFVVEGRVTVAPGLASEDAVTVAWVVKRAGDGGELANIGQTGAVPRGRLNQPWGPLARDIAEGGASGVAEALQAAKPRKQP